jgi:hypothetical protein
VHRTIPEDRTGCIAPNIHSRSDSPSPLKP